MDRDSVLKHNQTFPKEVECAHGLWVGVDCEECRKIIKHVQSNNSNKED